MAEGITFRVKVDSASKAEQFAADLDLLGNDLRNEKEQIDSSFQTINSKWIVDGSIGYAKQKYEKDINRGLEYMNNIINSVTTFATNIRTGTDETMRNNS